MSWCSKKCSVTSAKARQETSSVEASQIAPDLKCYYFTGAPKAQGLAFGASPGPNGVNWFASTLLSPLQCLPDCEYFREGMVADSSLYSFKTRPDNTWQMILKFI